MAARQIRRECVFADPRSAAGVTVPDEECFLGEIDAPLHPKIRRLLLPGFTPDAANRAEAVGVSALAQRLFIDSSSGVLSTNSSSEYLFRYLSGLVATFAAN